jgi:ferredoxin-NADP reductase
LVALPLGGLAALRLKPRSQPTYLLYRIMHEAGRSTSVVLRAQDHVGQRLEPGQFAWLRLAGTRRAYEGFSARVARLPVGTRFHVDGPHGAFRVRACAKGMVLVAYGIGITPSMSILRTAFDRGDVRSFILFYANRNAEDVTFGDELDAVCEGLDLRVVHVLSGPHEDWRGERGRISAAVLDRYLPEDLSRWDFFLCGAAAPVESGIAALAENGIPHERVHAERFVEV